MSSVLGVRFAAGADGALHRFETSSSRFVTSTYASYMVAEQAGTDLPT